MAQDDALLIATTNISANQDKTLHQIKMSVALWLFSEAQRASLD